MSSKKIIPSSDEMPAPNTDFENNVLIVSASFEKRSLAIAESFPSERFFKIGLIYANNEFLSGSAEDSTKNNMDQLEKLLTVRCATVISKIGSWLDPEKQLKALNEIVDGASQYVADKSKIAIYLDSTSFTRESLIVGCALIRRQLKSHFFRLFYTVPQNHGRWLSRGFRGVRTIMGFGGIQIPGAPTILVVLSGFEPDRTTQIIDAHEPSQVLLGIGNPSTNNSFLKRNLEEQELVLARQDVKRFEFPANSVADCFKKLEALINEYIHNANLIIAPMSTKLSTVAAMLIAEKYSSVQLTYSLPGEYNTLSYSRGIKSLYIEDL